MSLQLTALGRENGLDSADGARVHFSPRVQLTGGACHPNTYVRKQAQRGK